MKSISSPSRRRITPPRFRFQSARGTVAPKQAVARHQLHAQAVALQRWGRAQSSVAAAQGTCYLGMGLWPLTHLHSFELITGPKHNAALMQVAGSLLAVIGIILLLGSLQKVVSSTTTLLGAGIAGVLAILATTFVSAGRMPVIYLWDAALETGFVAWWVVARLGANRRHRTQQQLQQLQELEEIPYTTLLSAEQLKTLN